MNRIDYELGLMSSEEDFQNADGVGIAKAVRAACKAKCFPILNSRKKSDCRSKCDAAYNAKINYIQNSQLTATAADVENAAAAAAAAATPKPLGIESIKPLGIASIVAPKRPQETAETTSSNDSDKKGLGTGAKICIGVGVIALIIGGVFLLKRKK